MADTLNRTKKSFALKRRGQGEQPAAVEETPIVQVEAPVQQGPKSEELLYQGEIFDQFYRPISSCGGVSDLGEIAREEVSRPTPSNVRRLVPSKARVAELQEAAEALSHQLYKLSQKVRETDLDVYLSAFNVILGSRPVKDAKELLDYANAFFTEHYYAVIRERGERPEIFQQIIKRTGHATAARLRKIVNGLDVETVSRKLWDLYHSPDSEKLTKITDILLDCTPAQVRALREEFFFIPYRDLAQQMWTVLHRSDGNDTVKKTIGRSEIQEQRKKVAARSRDEAGALICILAGRTRDEISLIRHCYENISATESTDTDVVPLEDEIRKRFQPSQAKQVLKLLSGWNVEDEVNEIHAMLFETKPHLVPGDTLSDTRDPVERDFNTGLLHLNRKFKKRKIIRDFTRMKDRILAVLESLEERIYPLSPAQVDQLNSTLNSRYGYSLPLELFEFHRSADARQRARAIQERLPVARTLPDLLKLLVMLSPKQSLAVATAYRCSTGIVLAEAVIERAREISGGELTSEQEFLFELHLTGHARWPLNLDLLARYRGEEAAPDVWDVDFVADEATENTTVNLAEVINSLLPVQETLAKVTQLLRSREPAKRSQIERSFFELSDPQTPLISSLDGPSHGAEEDQITLLLLGFDADNIISEVTADVRKIPALLVNAPILLIETVKNLFEARTGTNLIEHVEREVPEGVDLVDILGVLLRPEAYEFHQLLFDLRKDRPALLENFREPWTWPIARRLAFERAYDIDFPRLRVDIKFAAGRNAIVTREFVNAILYLEGVDPSVIEQITEHFDAVDIDRMLEVLGEHRHDQNVVEECYDLLNPEHTLRRSIKAMQVPLDKINETLLHIEGYYPKDVAAEIWRLFTDLKGAELGIAVLDVVDPGDEVTRNERIPTDINWIDEMTRQIALAFERAYGQTLLEKLRSVEVPTDLLEKVTERVYGADIAGFARQIYQLINQHIDGITVSDGDEDRLAVFIEMRGIRYRELIAQAYRAHWQRLPGMGPMIEDIEKHLKSAAAKKKLIQSLSPPKVKSTLGSIPAPPQIPAVT